MNREFIKTTPKHLSDNFKNQEETSGLELNSSIDIPNGTRDSLDKKRTSQRKIFIIIAVILSLMAGFIALNINNSPTKSKALEFSMLYNERPLTPYKDDWQILTEYKDRKNVTFNITLGDDSNYQNDIEKAFETGSVPDIVLKVWPKDIEKYANSGLLLPFSDYEDKMPNFMSYIKENNLDNELDKIRLDNEKYYILPGFQRQIQVQQWIYRQDIFEKNNLEMPTTYDELFDSLVKLKKVYPESTPITTLWGGAHLFAMMGAGYDTSAGWSGVKHYNSKLNKWEFSPSTDNYRELYRFLNRCYEADILDPAFFTQTDDEFYEKLYTNKGFVTVSWITSGFDSWNKNLHDNGIIGGVWAPFPVPESTMGITALPAIDSFRKGLIVPSKIINKPYFNDLIEFLDWAVYSDEGRTLTTWGIEGVTYEDTAKGKVYLTNIKTPKNESGTINVSEEYGYDLIFNLVENQEFEDYKKSEKILSFLNRSLSAKEALEVGPKITLDSQDVELTTTISEQLTTYVSESNRKFITGKLDIDADWSAYILELNKRGYTALEEVWNSAWINQGK